MLCLLNQLGITLGIKKKKKYKKRQDLDSLVYENFK